MDDAERPLRRNRDFVALWTGQAASALGSSVSSLAYPLLLLAMTGSSALAGAGAAVMAATTFLFGSRPVWSLIGLIASG